MLFLLLSLAIATLGGCTAAPQTGRAEAVQTEKKGETMPQTVNKTDDEWRAQLTPEQYHVTREKGTERPFTGAFWNTKTAGTYKCVCCGHELFSSDTKFESGCGWPSFSAPLEGADIHESEDRSFGMLRTEVTCSHCGAHLGHVFDDGPKPTGLRYCINSASLTLQPADEQPPTP